MNGDLDSWSHGGGTGFGDDANDLTHKVLEVVVRGVSGFNRQ